MICAANKLAEHCLSLLRLFLPEENPVGNECIESTGIKAAQTPLPLPPHHLAITRRLDPRIPRPTVLRPETPLLCPLPHHRGFNLFVKCLLSQDLPRQSQPQFLRLPAQRQRPAALPHSLQVDRQVARKTDQQAMEGQIARLFCFSLALPTLGCCPHSVRQLMEHFLDRLQASRSLTSTSALWVALPA
jgi:hypothetical protein